MIRCVNEECNNNPIDNPNHVMWGCDGDFCCNQECYKAAKEQMNYFYENILTDNKKFNQWLLGD